MDDFKLYQSFGRVDSRSVSAFYNDISVDKKEILRKRGLFFPTTPGNVPYPKEWHDYEIDYFAGRLRMYLEGIGMPNNRFYPGDHVTGYYEGCTFERQSDGRCVLVKPLIEARKESNSYSMLISEIVQIEENFFKDAEPVSDMSKLECSQYAYRVLMCWLKSHNFASDGRYIIGDDVSLARSDMKCIDKCFVSKRTIGSRCIVLNHVGSLYVQLEDGSVYTRRSGYEEDLLLECEYYDKTDEFIVLDCVWIEKKYDLFVDRYRMLLQMRLPDNFVVCRYYRISGIDELMKLDYYDSVGLVFTPFDSRYREMGSDRSIWVPCTRISLNVFIQNDGSPYVHDNGRFRSISEKINFYNYDRFGTVQLRYSRSLASWLLHKYIDKGKLHSFFSACRIMEYVSNPVYLFELYKVGGKIFSRDR